MQALSSLKFDSPKDMCWHTAVVMQVYNVARCHGFFPSKSLFPGPGTYFLFAFLRESFQSLMAFPHTFPYSQETGSKRISPFHSLSRHIDCTVIPYESGVCFVLSSSPPVNVDALQQDRIGLCEVHVTLKRRTIFLKYFFSFKKSL